MPLSFRIKAPWEKSGEFLFSNVMKQKLLTRKNPDPFFLKNKSMCILTQTEWTTESILHIFLLH